MYLYFQKYIFCQKNWDDELSIFFFLIIWNFLDFIYLVGTFNSLVGLIKFNVHEKLLLCKTYIKWIPVDHYVWDWRLKCFNCHLILKLWEM